MVKKLILVVVGVAVLMSCAQPRSGGGFRPASSDIQLGVSTPVKTLAKHAADTFRIDLDSAMFVYGSANQINFDAIVDVYGPDKKKLVGFDSPARGPEYYRFKSKTTGVHRIVVTPYKDNAGDYTFVVDGAEPAATTLEGIADQYMRAVMGPDTWAPGATVAVMKDGKQVFSKGYGYADMESDRKNTPTTIFHVASVSKQFTSFAIAMLADQGKLSLDDDIRKYLPELHDFGAPITINHLVHHTSGLRDQWNLLMMAGWRLDDVITEAQIMRVISRQHDLNFKPGDEFLYCNTGFTLMAVIVKRVTGQTLNEWTKANVFEPLGMKNTFFYDDHEKVVKNRAYSYYNNGRGEGYKKDVLSYANAGATSLFTTAEDLNTWAQNFETMKVGNAKVMAMMNTPFILTKGDTTQYTFGQGTGTFRGLKIISHSGGDAGYRSFLLRIPSEHYSVAVASNYAGFNPGQLAFLVTEGVLRDKLQPEKPRADEPPQPDEKNDFDPKSLRLADYVGSFYSDELETSYSFTVEKDTLTSHHQRHDDFKLNPIAPDKFGMNFVGDVTFTRDKSGKVDGFKATNGRVRNLVFRKHGN